MHKSYKSFANRLAALEQLERAAEVAAEANADIPDVAAMDDGMVVWETTLAIREFRLHVDLRSNRFTVSPTRYRDPRWDTFHDALADRANPLIEAAAKPIVLLAPWEAEHAIVAIDAGLCTVAHRGYDNSRGTRSDCDYHLALRWGLLSDAPDEDTRQEYLDVQETCAAVARAHDLVQRQLYYPQPRDFSKPEMTTLAEWRAWLVSIGE